jgi:hypothetical protein
MRRVVVEQARISSVMIVVAFKFKSRSYPSRHTEKLLANIFALTNLASTSFQIRNYKILIAELASYCNNVLFDVLALV